MDEWVESVVEEVADGFDDESMLKVSNSSSSEG